MQGASSYNSEEACTFSLKFRLHLVKLFCTIFKLKVWVLFYTNLCILPLLFLLLTHCVALYLYTICNNGIAPWFIIKWVLSLHERFFIAKQPSSVLFSGWKGMFILINPCLTAKSQSKISIVSKPSQIFTEIKDTLNYLNVHHNSDTNMILSTQTVSYLSQNEVWEYKVYLNIDST